MTAYYKMPGFTIARSNLSTKVLITAFLVTVLLGLWVALMQYWDRAGTSGKDAEEWVLGNEGDFEATEIKPEKSFRELLSITHEHAFSLPILLFVLLHLVGLCTISERLKVTLYLAGFLSLMGSLAGPWLIYGVDPSWNVLMRVCGIVMTVVLALSAAICLYEMWLAVPIRRRLGRPTPPPPEPMFPKLRDAASGESERTD